MHKVMLIFGTRPEAIKMAPVYQAFLSHKDFQMKVVTTGQHTDLLNQVIQAFNIHVDYDLKIMKDKQGISYIISSILDRLPEVLEAEKPEMVFVHGDTSTSFAAALAAFNMQIPVAHVEAGLRTNNKYFPFPEEMNRRLTGQIAQLHFAPTMKNEGNLRREGILNHIYVVGNTIVDALRITVKDNYKFNEECLNMMDFKSCRYILVTAHRRENWGQHIGELCQALKNLTKEYENVRFIWPVHANPIVNNQVHELCGDCENIILLKPLDVFDTHNLIAKCHLIVTDSGGIQEESTALGKPVLIFRKETERIEAVDAQVARLIGTSYDGVFMNVKEILNNENLYQRMANASDVFGDGYTSEHIVEYVRRYLDDKSNEVII